MSLSFTDQARRNLDIASEQVDREHITVWLMQFAGRRRLALEHPRMGRIVFEGIEFSGSVVDIYDRYVSLVIDDLVAETCRTVEEALPDLPRQGRAIAVKEMIGAIGAAKARLVHRARDIKGAAMGYRGTGAPMPNIRAQISWTPYAERLRQSLESLRIADMMKQKVTKSWFNRYDNALARMRDADPAQFAARAGRLASVLREPEIADVRSMLTEGLKLRPFLDKARSEEVALGEPFPFPTDPLGEMGVAILLLDELASDNRTAEILAMSHYDVPHDNRIVAPWIKMVDQVYAPLRMEMHDYLESQGWVESEQPLSSDRGNSVVVQSSTGVVIQQGTRGSTLSANVEVNADAIRETLAEFAKAMSPFVDAAIRREFDAEIQTIEAQLDKPRPNSTILRECGSSLRSICEGLAAGALTPAAIAAASQLWALLGVS